MAHAELEYVTVAFCDLVSSTEQATALAPEVWAQRLDDYFTVVEATMVEHGGRVEKFIGDAVCAVFSADHRGQRASLSALRAAHATITALGRDGLEVRIGLSTGYAAVNDRTSTFAVGPVMNRSARLQSHGAPGDVVVDTATWVLVSGAVAEAREVILDLKGIGGAVSAHVITRLATDDALGPRSAFVGRQYELESLRRLVAAQPPGVSVVQVIGPTGIGKTRLVTELVRSREAEGAATLVLTHEPDRHVGGLLPLYQLAYACRTAGPEATIKVSTLTECGPDSPETTAGQRVEDVWDDVVVSLDAWLGGRPLLVVQDDHAAAPHSVSDVQTRLKALVHGNERALVVLRVTRDRDDTVPGTLLVPPLTEAECHQLVASAAAPDLEVHAQTDVMKVSGGNPLFIEQLVRHGMLLAADLPLATLEAVLGERIAALSRGARQVLLLIAASSGRLDVEGLELCAVGSEVESSLRSSVSELVVHEMIDDLDVTYGRLVLLCVSLGAVVERRATRASLANAHERLARYWRTRRVQHPAHAEIEAEHWLASLRALMDGGRRQSCPTEDAHLIRDAVAESVRAAILRGEPSVARVWLDDPGLELLEDQGDLLLLDALAHGYLGAHEEANAALLRAEHRSGEQGLEARALLHWARTILVGATDQEALSRLADQARDRGDGPALAAAEFTSGLLRMRAGDYDSARNLLMDAWRASCGQPSMCEIDIRTNLALADVYSSAPAREVADTLVQISEGLQEGSLAALALRASRAQVMHLQGELAHAHAGIDELLPEFRRRGLMAAVGQLHGLKAWMFVREGRTAMAARSWREQHAMVASALHGLARPIAGLIDLAVWTPARGPGVLRDWQPVDGFQALTAQLVDALSGSRAQRSDAVRAVVSTFDSAVPLGAYQEVLLLAWQVAALDGSTEAVVLAERRVREIARIRGDHGLALVER